MNEVGFRFHELSLGQVKALDCGNSLGPILAKNSRNTRGKLRFFLVGVARWSNSASSYRHLGGMRGVVGATKMNVATWVPCTVGACLFVNM